MGLAHRHHRSQSQCAVQNPDVHVPLRCINTTLSTSLSVGGFLQFARGLFWLLGGLKLVHVRLATANDSSPLLDNTHAPFITSAAAFRTYSRVWGILGN
ncbi:hypothetical protein NDU88_005998 [Pleurodeles waltl]|uniref:Uncharacterized protein n=1 Tax=Pleurodeles waltl TaxID=8319 RepID=A0AAV7RKR7_PLEWA|nr:hypothetical protein NDU88_005998 [Pleurodeles waltl]